MATEKRLSMSIKRLIMYLRFLKTYSDLAKEKRLDDESTVVYLGSDFNEFDKYYEKKEKVSTIKFVYLGTLGHSYDLGLLLDALET
ncbi:hypothetical protein ABW365_16105 [Enterococcus avium]